MSCNYLISKYGGYVPFILSEHSINKILKAFPKIRKDILDIISQTMDRELDRNERLSGQKKEHKTTTGLCGEISGKILQFLKEEYPDIKLVDGFYKLDKHPRFKPDEKISSMHVWLEADNKILDFTANQFAPFVNDKIDQVEILPKANAHRYMKNRGAVIDGAIFTDRFEYKDVGIDEDSFVLNWYIENL